MVWPCRAEFFSFFLKRDYNICHFSLIFTIFRKRTKEITQKKKISASGQERLSLLVLLHKPVFSVSVGSLSLYCQIGDCIKCSKSSAKTIFQEEQKIPGCPCDLFVSAGGQETDFLFSVATNQFSSLCGNHPCFQGSTLSIARLPWASRYRGGAGKT